MTPTVADTANEWATDIAHFNSENAAW